MGENVDSSPRDYKQLYHETLTLCENREHDIEVLQAQNAELKHQLKDIKDKVQEIANRLKVSHL